MRCFRDFGDFMEHIFQFLPTNIQIPLKHEQSILLFRLKTTIEEAGVLLLIHTWHSYRNFCRKGVKQEGSKARVAGNASVSRTVCKNSILYPNQTLEPYHLLKFQIKRSSRSFSIRTYNTTFLGPFIELRSLEFWRFIDDLFYNLF